MIGPLCFFVLLAATVDVVSASTPAEAVAAEVRGILAVMEDGRGGIEPPAVDGVVNENEVFAVKGGTPGDFGLYIFAMSWKAEWCYHQIYPGCKAPRGFWEDNLTIHGLWPDYGDGTYPTTCTKEAYDHDRVVNAVGLDVLETMWPNIQVPENAGTKYDSFWEHEWTKHGTCTGLTQEAYFSAALSLLKGRFETPPQLTQNVGGHTTRVELEDAYGGDGMAVLDCRGRVHLNQVYLCLEPDKDTGLPGEQVACPSAVVAHDDTCGQDSLEIASF
eukprot:jgi/Undpi1/12889/HiC_scaffold_7.g02555.m1